MSDDPGVCLAGWSDVFSSWVSIAVSRDRESIEHLAGRLAMLGLVIRFFRLRPWMMRTRKRRRSRVRCRSCGVRRPRCGRSERVMTFHAWDGFCELLGELLYELLLVLPDAERTAF